MHILGFSVPSIILADLLGNTCLLARVQKVSQGLPCYTAVARLGFTRHTTAVLKSNLIQSIEFGTAVARRLKQALVATVSTKQ